MKFLAFILFVDQFWFIKFSADSEAAFQQFQHLQDIDESICDYGEKIIKYLFTQHSGLSNNHRGAAENNINLAGSVSEHGAVPRIFKQNERFPDKLNREFEVDIEYVLLEVPLSMQDHIQEIPSRKGFVRLKTDKHLLANINKIGWQVSDEQIDDALKKTTTADGFLQPYKFKEETLKKVAFQDTDRFAELLIAAALDEKQKHVKITTLTESVTRATVASEFLISIRKKPFLTLAIDTVTLFRLSWWPSIGDEWKHRERNWPSKTIIEDMSSIGYIIAKPSDKENMETTELRYSFAHIERKLVHMRSRHQNLVYLVFKVMFYKWIKPIHSDRLQSFIAKTIMFWTCEDFPPDHEIWKNDFQSLIKVLSHLFNKLSDALNVGQLKYFFNNEINVIESVSLEIRTKAKIKVQEILNDITGHLPIPMDKELKAAKDILNVAKATAAIFEEIKNKDFSRLIRQPNLIPDVLSFYLKSDDVKKIKNKLVKVTNRVLDEFARFEDRIHDLFD